MGREKTILLGFLGLLAGVFVGALSLKLLVPRPPTGTGPDVRTEVADVTPQERVEPPAPTPGGWDFAAAPPLVPDPPAPDPATVNAPFELPPAPVVPARFGRSATPPPEAVTPQPVAGVIVDAEVTPAAWHRIEPAVEDPATSPPAGPIAGTYHVRDGDSWWAVAERAYGDGRLYRALFAWNRSRDPRVTLAPGTQLDVPPLERLQAAWPRLAAPP